MAYESIRKMTVGTHTTVKLLEELIEGMSAGAKVTIEANKIVITDEPSRGGW